MRDLDMGGVCSYGGGTITLLVPVEFLTAHFRHCVCERRI